MRVDWAQQLVIDTSAGTEAHGTIPGDTGGAKASPGMYSGNSLWLMFVSKIAHNIVSSYPGTAVASRTQATAANGLIPITNDIPIPQEIPVGTIISAITDGGAATTGAKITFVKCYVP